MKTVKLLLLATALGAVTTSFAQLPNNLSAADKVYGLSKFWQEVNYNFVYLNKIDRNLWDAYYRQLIAEVQATPNDYEYYRLLQKFCAQLNDGHTNIYFPPSVDSLVYMADFGEYRLFLDDIEGKAVVVGINLSKKDELPVGTEILSVNDVPSQTYREEQVKPYISSSTDYIRARLSAMLMLYSPVGTTYTLKLKKPDGTVAELTLTHAKSAEEATYPPKPQRDLLEFKWLNRETAYLALNSFADPKIDSLFLLKLPEVKKAKKLVIDLRNNGGGNTNIGAEILQYFTHDKELYFSASQSRLHIPAYKAWGKWTQPQDTIGSENNKQSLLSYQDACYHNFDFKPTPIKLGKKERHVVPTVILIGNYTASAAEDFLIAADKQQHMTKIGEPTFGSTGQPLMFELPGGSWARICTKKDTYPDGREFVGYGIQPDIPVKRTYTDFIENKDVALQQAVDFLQKIQ